MNAWLARRSKPDAHEDDSDSSLVVAGPVGFSPDCPYAVRLAGVFDMVVSVNEELRAQTRSAYDAVASDYATIIPDTGFEAPLDLAMVNEIVSEVAKRPASKVLDAGCGAGRMVTYLQSQSPSLEVVGIDLSAEMIALARSSPLWLSM